MQDFLFQDNGDGASSLQRMGRRTELEPSVERRESSGLVGVGGVFRCIMADPPWPIKWAKNTSIRTRQLDYPTMRVAEIAELPVRDMADPLGCVLCMWVTNEYLPDGLALTRIWGFHYEKLFTWCKNNGMGGRPRNATEHFIIATRGCPKMGEGRNQDMLLNWAEAQKGAHSEKPECFVRAIESFTEAPRVELFARRKRPGWSVWGNQVASDVELRAGGGGAEHGDENGESKNGACSPTDQVQR